MSQDIRDRIDPLVRARLDRIVDVPPRQLGLRTPEQAAAEDMLNAPYGPYTPAEVDIEDTMAPGPHGPIAVRIYRPRGVVPDRGLVWMHGGAFIFGDLDMPEADQTSRELAERAHAIVVSVDYRLAVDGVHFPVPQDDVVAAWNWAVTQSGLLPQGAPWMIGGGSAGANLALSATIRLRDGEGPLPARLLPIYPVAHSPLPWSDELDRDIAVIPIFVRIPPEIGKVINRQYLGEHDGLVPAAFPGSTVADLSGQPPTLIVTCEFDDLRDSGSTYADQLRAAGVQVEYHMEPGVLHGHLNIIGHPATSRTLDVMARFMLQA